VANIRISSTTTSATAAPATSNPIAGMVRLAAWGLSMWGIVCAARITVAAISLLLTGLQRGVATTLITNLVLSGITGFFAAVATELLRQSFRRASNYSAPFFSSLFQRQLGESTLGVVFWSRVLIGGLVGLGVGALTGSMGMLNVSQFLWGTSEAVIHESAYPIMGLVGGGFGGPGGTGLFSLAFIVLVIIITALLAGLLIGVVAHVLVLALAGTTKGAAKAYFTKILRDEPCGVSDPNPIANGAVRGFITGLTVGVLESIFTILGIVKFYPR
jgi:hypothetical protein